MARQRRIRQWPAAVVKEIRRLRSAHPRLGASKVHVLLGSWCARHGHGLPSARTIARLIADTPDRMYAPPVRLGSRGGPRPVRVYKIPRKPKGFRVHYPGHCVALDTVERHRDGLRRYLLTATDVYSRFGLASGTHSHASTAAAASLQLFVAVFPFPVYAVLTDNGSEFAREFARTLERAQCRHWRTYPRAAKMNAHAERFNRTVQEEFVDYHEDTLFGELETFNERLFEHLHWHNRHRPHHALELDTPAQRLAYYVGRPGQPSLSRMTWHQTRTCARGPMVYNPRFVPCVCQGTPY